MKVGTAAQTSGVTPNDFRSPITYRVTAEDGTSTKDYTVTVAIAPNPAKDLTAFSFEGLSPAVVATISGTTISATVPYGTDVSDLVATFSTTGSSVKVGTTLQASGITSNDFSSPVTYTVEAQDGTTKAYTVTVSVAASDAKDLTVFSFEGLSPAVVATISGTTISATVPYGTDVSDLVATYATTGSLVKVGSTLQASGVTPNDFSSPVTYIVEAQDGTTKAYTVTVSVAASDAKDITTFSFESLTPAVVGTISGTAISATVPYGTDVSGLVATFVTTGSIVKVGTTVQASEMTPNDFSSPVTYTVEAQDGSTKSYTVTVSVAASDAKDLTAFSFEGLTPAVVGTISGTTISATVPYGTDVSGLVATYATTGSLVKVGSTLQASGLTPNDFSLSVTYTVTAQDGTTKSYTVTVTVAANPNPGGNPSQPSGGGGGSTIDLSEAFIPAGQKGEVALDDEFRILVPSGSTDRDLRLKVTQVKDTSRLFEQGENSASSVFEAVKSLTGRFLSPITISMKFDPARIKGEMKPSIFYYDEQRMKWVELGGVVSGNRITVEVDHFTKFAVLAVGKSADIEVDTNEGSPADPVASFVDIQKHWAEKEILQAIIHKFVAGYSDGTFRPNQAVTRAEFAVMLVRALNLPNKKASLAYKDNDRIGTWAQDAIARAAEAGLLRGYSDGTFRPNDRITRAEMAVMVANALHAGPDRRPSLILQTAKRFRSGRKKP
ncbi:S-layer homology domain-containing protein [Cohnella herbarum]|uniref:SLH domain-containing protein n=1 Tax=Cohnella herbarum TaxID=2728023 RepID=A0A7Z2VKC3_9BACL|nr:S-layer homology domain-containing protein [Cohnella herbarum]QJD84601.1 hypothetical protein HH215_16385 [Cohnella herbarum]